MLSHEVAADLGFQEKAPYLAIAGATMLALWLLFTSDYSARRLSMGLQAVPAEAHQAAAAQVNRVKATRRWPVSAGVLAPVPGEA